MSETGKRLTFGPTLYSQGRAWESDTGAWKVVMFGMGRYRLFHGTHYLGEFPDRLKAQETAQALQDILDQ